MQLDFFDNAIVLEMQKDIADLKKTQSKTRRSLYARLNEAEAMILEIHKALEEREKEVKQG